MNRRALLITGVGCLGGCLDNGADTTQGSNGTDQDEEADGTDQENESDGTAEEPDSNTTDQDNTSNGTDQDDRDRETRTYKIEAETSSESPIRHEFEVTQPDIHSADSPLTLTVSISNTTDETIAYGSKRPVMGIYLKHGEFILVPTFDGSSSPELGGSARPKEDMSIRSTRRNECGLRPSANRLRGDGHVRGA